MCEDGWLNLSVIPYPSVASASAVTPYVQLATLMSLYRKRAREHAMPLCVTAEHIS